MVPAISSNRINWLKVAACMLGLVVYTVVYVQWIKPPLLVYVHDFGELHRRAVVIVSIVPFMILQVFAWWYYSQTDHYRKWQKRKG